ncbi:MAG: glycoside hydrolase family 9 protein, partial [Fibrobacter sp.]|nr:glycoside hydrolase family 9 protein [Fibrobacter sp.]
MKRTMFIPLSMALATSAFAANFYYNQVGYDKGMPISIIVKSDAKLDGAEFKLMSGGNAVQTGTLSKGSNPDNWTNNGKFYVANLDKGVAAGTYTLQITENGQPATSGEFKVEDNALAKLTLGAVLDYFYDDRAVNPTIVGWDSKLPVYNGGGKTLDVHGGWYDASGYVSKYLSHLSYANYLNPQQIPLTVWSLAFAAERIPQLLGQTSTKAKTEDEAAFGADFLVRMLDDQGFFYMTVFDNWGSPTGKRELCAFSGSDGIKSANYQTAFREGGGMAIAGLARVSKLGVKGDYTSEQYLAAAEKAYAHLSEKQGIGKSCEYCDDNKENIIDDYTALLAATELYIATEKVDYLKDARARAKNLINRLSDDGYFWSDDAKTRPFWHASDAGLPLVALVRYAEVESKITMNSPSELIDWYCVDMIGASSYNYNAKDALDAIKAHLDWLVGITNKVENPFGYAR